MFTIKFKDSIIPIKKPLATIAGIIGTKISPNVLIALLNKFVCAVAAAFTSSLVLAVSPEIAINSSYTLFTIPVPNIICNCPEAKNTPFTPSTSSTASLSHLLLSAITRRNLVAQCAAEIKFSFPPTFS